MSLHKSIIQSVACWQGGRLSFRISEILTIVVGLSVSLLLGMSSLTREALFACMISILIALAEYASWHLFFECPRDTIFGWSGGRLFFRIIAASMFLALLFELGTLIGAQCASPLHLIDWQPPRLAILFVVSYCVILIAAYCLDASLLSSLRKVLYACFGSLELIRLLLIFVLSSTTAVVARIQVGLAPVPLFFLAVAFYSLVFFCIRFYRGWTIRPESIFAIIALAVGFTIISAFPISNMLSWDDEVHYSNALRLSYIMQPEVSSSDEMMQTVGVVKPGFSENGTLGRTDIIYSRFQ